MSNFINYENVFQNLKNSVISNVHNIAEPFIPLLTETQYSINGTLTPEEFISAGDLLCLKCPSWSWVSCNNDKKKSYLPVNKQYLITKNVPKTLIKNNKVTTKMHKIIKNVDSKNFADLLFDDFLENTEDYNKYEEIEYDNKCTEDDNSEDDDELFIDDSLIKSSNDNIIKTRTYDLHITYDRYYRGPKLWIFGRSENGYHLSYEEILQDVGNDYVNKTATEEIHPFIGIPFLTIHNCRHAELLKKFSNGSRPDKSLFLFLKFMSSIIPNINYDFTVDISLLKY